VNAAGRAGVRALVAICGAAVALGCGARAQTPAQVAVRSTSLHLAPISGLLKAPGLKWAICTTPREFMLAPALAAAQQQLIPEQRFAKLRTRAGGVDFRALDELCVAQYTDSQLLVGRGLLDPGRVEQAFQADVELTEARAVDRLSPDGADTIVRLLGRNRSASVQLALFGRTGFALQYGPDRAALRAAIAFAEGKLTRSKPALQVGPLLDLSKLVGPADAVFLAPGPFEGEVGSGIGGLLRSATAVAIRMRVVDLAPLAPSTQARPGFAFTVFLQGAYDRDYLGALSLLGATFGRYAASDLGKLIGVDHPALPPRTRVEGNALVLDVTYDAEALAHGVHVALEGEIDEILQVSPAKKD
jgi:hypothetical protein